MTAPPPPRRLSDGVMRAAVLQLGALTLLALLTTFVWLISLGEATTPAEHHDARVFGASVGVPVLVVLVAFVLGLTTAARHGFALLLGVEAVSALAAVGLPLGLLTTGHTGDLRTVTVCALVYLVLAGLTVWSVRRRPYY